MRTQLSAVPSSAQTKSNTPIEAKKRWEIYRLAKAARGLSTTEKRALIFIAEAQTMTDGVCKKAAHGAEDFGTSVRDFRRGIHGRKRKDGTQIFPGLTARGIVSASGNLKGGRSLGGNGLPVTYTINKDVLLTFVPEESDALHPAQKDVHKGDQKDVHYPVPVADKVLNSLSSLNSGLEGNGGMDGSLASTPVLEKKNHGQEKDSTPAYMDELIGRMPSVPTSLRHQ
jgi:hypothetical protein